MPRLRLFLALLVTTLCILSFACTPTQKPPQIVSVPVAPPPPVRPSWSGEKAQVVIIDFEDRTGNQVNRRRSLLGRGMEAQLTTALRRTGQFTILEPSEKTVRNRRGNPITARVGRIDEPEFFISGSVTLYQLSPASVAAGVHADPLLGTAQPLAESFQAEAAQRTFTNLASNARDRIQIILRLFDGQTGQVVDETQITTTAKDFSPNIEGMFSTALLQDTVPTEPASQRAVRASVIRAVNWLGETCQEYRRQRESEATRGAARSPAENSR